MIRRVVVVLAAVALAACGPNVHEHEDAAPQPGAPDAAPPDAPPWMPEPDGAPGLMYTVYAHSRDTLYTIDPDSFAVTIIGTFGNGDNITDLAVTPDGTLYGISTTKLYVIDRTTAAATLVGPVPGLTNVGMTFLPGGELLATDKDGGVRRINPETGAVTEIGVFGGGWATAGDLVAVADGTMYAISDEGPVGDEYTNNWLLTVDTATGAATGVGQIGYGQVFGCAYANGNVYAFTADGKIVEIDPVTGAGTVVKEHALEFWGAGVTPLVPPIP